MKTTIIFLILILLAPSEATAQNTDDYIPSLPYDLKLQDITFPDNQTTVYDVQTAVPECWQPLTGQLVADGFEKDIIETIFIRLGSDYSDKPMRTKLEELYKIKFRKPKKPSTGKPKVTYYKNVVTDKNINRARFFLEEHETALNEAAKLYGVPKEIAVALILVETDLGDYLGKHKALTNLASMAASTDPEGLIQHFPNISGNATKEEWMQTVMTKRSSWAYGELKAFLSYCISNEIDPLYIDGSIYGAIGYCQFMPSNILLFGVDGNNNGKIDLFEPEDAIYSLCNFLKVHGWKEELSRDEKHKVLLYYNRSSAYANTILMVGEKLAETPGSDENKNIE